MYSLRWKFCRYSGLLLALVLLSAFTAPLPSFATDSGVLQVQDTQEESLYPHLSHPVEYETTAATTLACVRLEKTLYFSSNDSASAGEVTKLQQFLAQDSTLYPEGEVTGFFGSATERAVKRFQFRNNIVSGGHRDETGYGVVGALTRSALARACTDTVTSSIQTVSAPEGNSFTINQIALVTKKVQNIISTYTIVLTDGSIRTVRIPKDVKRAVRTQLFEATGYKGNVSKLIAKAKKEKKKKRSGGGGGGSSTYSQSSYSAYSQSSYGPVISSKCEIKNGDGPSEIDTLVKAGCAELVTKAGTVVVFDTRNTYKIPAQVKLLFEEGALWKIKSGTNVEVSGTYSIPSVRKKFFSIESGGKISSVWQNATKSCGLEAKKSYPEWFGAVPNDSVDDSIEIRHAVEFGNRVELGAGQYDIKNRIILNRNQSFIGAGQDVTKLVHDAQPNLLQWDAKGVFKEVGWIDFVLGIDSNCVTVRDFAIDASKPDEQGVRDLTNFDEKVGVLNVSAIKISLGNDWVKNLAPISNITLTNLKINKPVNSCIYVWSNRSAKDIAMDNITCVARDTQNYQSSGISLSGQVAKEPNRISNVSIKNSSFTGGRWTVYIAGVTNMVIDNTTIVARENALSAIKFYTSDIGDPSTVTIKNSRISHMTPSKTTFTNTKDELAVIHVVGRPLHCDMVGIPCLTTPQTGLTIENSTIETSKDAAVQVPLIRESIGLTDGVTIKNSTFIGGSFALLAAHPTDNSLYGGFKLTKQKIVSPLCDVVLTGYETPCDFTEEELKTYKLKHSSFILRGNTFRDQAEAAVRLNFASLDARGNSFIGTGQRNNAVTRGAIELLSMSPFDTQSSPKNTISSNTFSSITNSSFVKMYPSVKFEDLKYTNNPGTTKDGALSEDKQISFYPETKNVLKITNPTNAVPFYRGEVNEITWSGFSPQAGAKVRLFLYNKASPNIESSYQAAFPTQPLSGSYPYNIATLPNDGRCVNNICGTYQIIGRILSQEGVVLHETRSEDFIIRTRPI